MIALQAAFAPALAIGAWVAARLRGRHGTGREVSAGEDVVVLASRAASKRNHVSPRPDGGAIVLPFRPRSSPAMTLDDPPALTGSR